MSAILKVIHPFCTKPDVEFEPSAYCPNDMCYFLPGSGDFPKIAKSMYEIEKEKKMNGFVVMIMYLKD